MKEITARCKFCGGFGQRAKDYTAYSGQYASHVLHCVECATCHKHTVHARTWDGAIKNWNEQKYSEETMILAEDLTADNMGTKGAISLVEKLLDEQYKEYSTTLNRLIFGASEGQRPFLIDVKNRCERWYMTTKFLGMVGFTGEEIIKSIKRKTGYGED